MNWNGDKNKVILVFLILFFTTAYLAVLFLRPGDEKSFLFLTGVISSLLLTLARDMTTAKEKPPPGSVTTSNMQQETKTPAEPVVGVLKEPLLEE